MLNLRSFVCVSALAAGCVVDPVPSSVVEGVAVPGPWQPSAMTRAVAATQHVTVVDPPAVSPLGRCTSTNPFACSCAHPACMAAFPGTRELNTHLFSTIPLTADELAQLVVLMNKIRSAAGDTVTPRED